MTSAGSRRKVIRRNKTRGRKGSYRGGRKSSKREKRRRKEETER